MSQAEYIWGSHVVTLLVNRKPENVMQVWIDLSHQAKYKNLIRNLERHEITLNLCSKKQMEQQFKDKPHQGVGAQIKPDAPKSQGWLLDLVSAKANPLIVILDEVQDPHNLGAVLRSACAFGVDAVVSPLKNSAPLSGAARKVASGGDLFVPFVQVTNLARCMEQLKKAGLWTIGASLAPEAVTLDKAPLTGPLAIVLGAEGKGLRQKTQAYCDHLAYIPMAETMESLNVSVACGIFLHQCQLQRTND